MRPTATTAARSQTTNPYAGSLQSEDAIVEVPPSDTAIKKPEQVVNEIPTERTFQQAQSQATRVYERPTKRRPPPVKDQTNIARESMIDQIMRESQVPLYDRPVSQTPVPNGEDADNDEAAADAFKAQLLADMELNRRRRPASTKKEGTTSTGPKLGGSRSQREKMRALEEAKGSGSKK